MSDEMKWGQTPQEPEHVAAGETDRVQQNNTPQSFDNNIETPGAGATPQATGNPYAGNGAGQQNPNQDTRPASHPYSAARYQNAEQNPGSAGTGYNAGQNAGSGNTGYSANQNAGNTGSQNPNQGYASQGQPDGQVPPKYAHYQVHQNGQQPQAGGRPPKKGKGGGFAKKAGTAVALAVIFGLVSGTVFQGVNYVSREYLGLGTRMASVGTTRTLDDEAAQTSAGAEDLSGVVAKGGTVAGVAQAAMPSVVAITSVSVQELPELDLFSFFYGGGGSTRQYQSAGSGSGIIVGENEDELLIATNNHVVEGATTLSVCFIGNDVVNAEQETQDLAGGGDINVEDAVTAKIKGTDPDNDLAVVSVNKKDIPEDTMKEIKIAQLGSSDNLVVGEQVVAIGNALGYGQSVTSGWVSALDRTVTMENGVSAQLIQTDAAINPGNSGGALLNMRGELIGINSSKYASNAVEGMGYAIPISKAQPILESLMSRKTRERVEDSSQAGYLGVQVAKDLPAEAIEMYNIPIGAFVLEVDEGGSAEQAGLQKNDIIVKLDGQKVSGQADLIDKLQYYEAGEEVEIVYARSNNGEYEEHTVTAVLGARPESSK